MLVTYQFGLGLNRIIKPYQNGLLHFLFIVVQPILLHYCSTALKLKMYDLEVLFVMYDYYLFIPADLCWYLIEV